MTYFGFLLRFLVIPILVFLAITYWDNKRNKQINGFRYGRAVWMGIAVHVLLAVIYTTPWDNYLVATGVWYYNPDLVTGILFDLNRVAGGETRRATNHHHKPARIVSKTKNVYSSRGT